MKDVPLDVHVERIREADDCCLDWHVISCFRKTKQFATAEGLRSPAAIG
jgi:hypothetical protein